MDKPLGFGRFLDLKEGNSRTAAKTLLYPMGYGGLGLYPPLHFFPVAADAVLYISKDERLFCNGDGPPWDIRHIPGHKQYGDGINNGESEPWNIKKVPGEAKEPKYRTPPGEVVPYKGFVRLVQAVKCLKLKEPKMPPE